MAAPVWLLSVDLQTKTATFQTGLADAAKAARGTFNDIKSGAGEMGGAVSGNMMEARHGVMLLGEEFGAHIPRALASFLASIGPVGAAMEAAFPFLAIAVGATLLLEHLNKLHEAGEQLTENQLKFQNAAAMAFNALDIKILEAEKRVDELRNDHFGALQKEIEIIDKQSLADIIGQFGKLGQFADFVFKDMQRKWYEIGAGSAGAKHAIDELSAGFEHLMLIGKTDEAHGLLMGTLAEAEKVRAAQKEIAEGAGTRTTLGGTDDYKKVREADAVLRKAGLTTSEEDQKIQQTVLDTLQDMVHSWERMNELKKDNVEIAKLTEGNRSDKDAGRAAEEAMEAAQEASDAEIRVLKEAGEKTVATLNESVRQQIATTKEGSAARLLAVIAGLQNEEAWGLKDSEFYRSLLTDRINLTRQLGEEAAKEKEKSGMEEAEAFERSGALMIQAEKQSDALINSSRFTSDAQRLAQAVKIADDEYNLKVITYAKEIAALVASGQQEAVKLKEIQDKEKQALQQHEVEVAELKEKAERESNQRVLAEAERFNDQMVRGLAQVLMGHESFAKMVTQLGNQVVSGMIENGIKEAEAAMIGKEADAAKAARKAYDIGVSIGGPAGMVLGSTFAALAFSTVSGFEGGGVVPGMPGAGDVVPAMLTPGEGVVPGGVMDGLSKMAREGGFSGRGHTYNLQLRPTYHIQTIDGDGMSDALEKHTDQLQRHFENTLRKMNR